MTTFAAEPPARPALPDSAADAVYRKVAVRLIPLLFLCYIAAYLDRVNVGFAKLQMQQALQLSESVYGLGAGIFFIGYFIFEIPSNVMLHRVGAGRWIARIMVSWAVLSAAMVFVNSATSFYIVRFLLGVAEAGFFPGIILYLTYWFPAARRGRATSLFLTAIAVAGLVGSPLSGWILHSLSGVAGRQGWQWLFVLEAVPSLVLGGLAWFWLEDRVKTRSGSRWQERDLIARDIAAEESRKSDGSLREVLSDAQVWLLALVYFAIVSGLYGVTFWLPTIIKETGREGPAAGGPDRRRAVGLRHPRDVRDGAQRRPPPGVSLAHRACLPGQRRGPGAQRGVPRRRAARDGRPDDRRDGHHVGPADLLEQPDRAPGRHRRGDGHRVHQLGGQPRGLRDPVPDRRHQGQDALHRRRACTCWRR